MNRLRKSSILFAVLAAAVALAACGGPSTPSAQGVVLKGTVVGFSGAAGKSLSASSATATNVVTVTVQEDPSITTTVGSDGSFTLRGLPEGSFTLIFKQGATTLGTLTFSAVKPNQEITITVDLSGGSVVLLEEQRNGIGHGDIEIEGKVEAVLALNPGGESRFTIAGHTVVARPGETSIREGNRRRTVNDVTVGRHVHVKGAWLDAEGNVQPVLAHEIELQGEDDGGGTPKTCMIEGGRVGAGVELEGHVASGGAGGFMLQVNGGRSSGLVDVDTGGASFECHPSSGPKAPTPDQCRASVKSGAQVHVSGTLESCSASSASVAASKVIVQK